MGCQVPRLNPQLFSNPKSKHSYRCRKFHPNFHFRTALFISYNNLNNPLTTTTVKQTQVPKPDAYNVSFRSLKSCKLGISRYPDFDYNADGGSGSGTATIGLNAEGDSEFSAVFDAQVLYVPPLSSATTKFLGLPLPPFLKIDIVPEAFGGRINQESGKVELEFRAEFWFSIGSVYKAPPLLVETVLTTEESKGMMRGGKGERLNKDGTCRLVGVATVEPINDVFMDTFLGLPTECLADLNAVISFSDM